MLSCEILAVLACLAFCRGTGQTAAEAGHVPPLWDYDNVTARSLAAGTTEEMQQRAEHFEFNGRVPKKPFTKKNNFLSFETKNNNIEVKY